MGIQKKVKTQISKKKKRFKDYKKTKAEKSSRLDQHPLAAQQFFFCQKPPQKSEKKRKKRKQCPKPNDTLTKPLPYLLPLSEMVLSVSPGTRLGKTTMKRRNKVGQRLVGWGFFVMSNIIIFRL